MKNKTFILSVFALAIIVIGCIIVCLMDFPAGMLIVVPCAIPHIYRIYKCIKAKL